MGTVLLRDMGIPPGSSIICFHARDNAFQVTLNPDADFSWHTHRGGDIDSNIPGH